MSTQKENNHLPVIRGVQYEDLQQFPCTVTYFLVSRLSEALKTGSRRFPLANRNGIEDGRFEFLMQVSAP